MSLYRGHVAYCFPTHLFCVIFEWACINPRIIFRLSGHLQIFISDVLALFCLATRWYGDGWFGRFAFYGSFVRFYEHGAITTSSSVGANLPPLTGSVWSLFMVLQRSGAGVTGPVLRWSDSMQESMGLSVPATMPLGYVHRITPTDWLVALSLCVCVCVCVCVCLCEFSSHQCTCTLVSVSIVGLLTYCIITLRSYPDGVLLRGCTMALGHCRCTSMASLQEQSPSAPPITRVPQRRCRTCAWVLTLLEATLDTSTLHR